MLPVVDIVLVWTYIRILSKKHEHCTFGNNTVAFCKQFLCFYPCGYLGHLLMTS